MLTLAELIDITDKYTEQYPERIALIGFIIAMIIILIEWWINKRKEAK